MTNTTTWIKRSILFLSFVILFTLIALLVFSRQERPGDGMEIVTFQTLGGWGYQLLMNDQVYIYQPFIPVEGNHPFPTKKSARSAGLLVADKLQNGEPPALTREELENIGAIEAPTPR